MTTVLPSHSSANPAGPAGTTTTTTITQTTTGGNNNSLPLRCEMRHPPRISASATAMYNSLIHHTARSIALTRDTGGVVEIDSRITPVDAAMILWEHNVLGVPVRNAQDQSYVGFFDMRDILSAIVATSRRMDKHDVPDEYTAVMVDSVDDLHHLDDHEMPLTTSYLASRNKFYTRTPNTPLITLTGLLAEADCRRILICNTPQSNCVNLISRSSIVKFMSQHVSPQEMNETLDEAGLPYRKNVVTISDTATAFETFDLIDAKGLYGVAVVDEDDKLVACTSARDIKHAAMDRGGTDMDTDIFTYLTFVRQKAMTDGRKARYPACHVYEDATVGHVVNLLAKTGYHRLFVVDKDMVPVGVVGVSDILQFTMDKSEKDSVNTLACRPSHVQFASK